MNGRAISRIRILPVPGEAGFTLFEVLIALAILGIATVTVLQLLAGSLRLSGQIGEASSALLEAERHLDESLVADDLREGRTGGRGWGREVVLLGTIQDGSARRYRILVWAQEGGRRVELATIRTVVPR